MALTGHLSDLSLSELIEFFCNQRKTGSLKVLYPNGAGYFYLQTGSVVDAQIGVLRGIDAVYYALTLPNAKFEFSATTEPAERTINQPWTQVVLEGLRRLDEGIEPPEAFPAGYASLSKEDVPAPVASAVSNHHAHIPAFLSFMSNQAVSSRKSMLLGAAGVAVLASVAVIGVPAGWYRHKEVAVQHNETVADSSSPSPSQPAEQPAAQPEPTASSQSNEEAQAVAKKQREKERRQREERTAVAAQPASVTTPASPAPSANDGAKSGPKRVVVTVTYDESGRVTQASGGDATALRIARQKRFPAGKGGSATVTIPIN
ncbi:MAG TPA: DUF4388 domain-containing protein [Pyrinomonadaceae bacterium]|nr:DUF4388 domain-containing protein [Pyrinomonadaceae bacterium]